MCLGICPIKVENNTDKNNKHNVGKYITLGTKLDNENSNP